MLLSADQEKRYERQLKLKEIGREGQEKLLDARVLVIGAGGLGSPTLMYLVGAGVGAVGIADGDIVDISNLHRQVLHTTADIGRPKVESAAETLRAMNPDVKINTYKTFVDAGNIEEIIKEYDFIIDAVDNLPAKFLINDACVLNEKPFSHAGILGGFGEAMTYVPGEGPCYRCIYNEIPPKEAVPTCAEKGVIGTAPGVLGNIQATEAIKYITGAGKLLTGTLLTIDLLNMEYDKITFPQGEHLEDCPLKGSSPTIRKIFADNYIY